MKKLSLGLKAYDVLHDIKLVREGIVDDATYQTADTGILLSNLDDIISMCEFAIARGFCTKASELDNFDKTPGDRQ